MPRPIHYGQKTVKAAPQAASQQAPHQTNPRCSALRETVLDQIGRPDDLSDVAVRPLWDEHHYRVNVYRNLKGCRKITDSYFIFMVEDGLIASPPLDRKYYDDVLTKIYEDRCDKSQ